MNAPLMFTWDGEAMVPKSPRMADRQYVVGQDYRLAEQEERSGASHRHYFAQIAETWRNLPDELAMEFTDTEKLRKHALIMTGWFKERKFAASSPVEARKIAAFLLERQDEYALISVAGNVVVERVARSQSTRAGGMRKAEFQKSKDDVLLWISDLIGVEPRVVAANTDKAA